MLKYKDLLNLEWTVELTLKQAERKWDEQTKQYGTDDILYSMNKNDVYDLRQALKTCREAINQLRKNDLYVYGD